MLLRLMFATFMMLGFLSMVRADDKNDESEARALNKLVELGPGVHAIKKDDKGRIVSCVIVGQSRVSTTLGKTKGLQVARDRARLEAQAQFVSWLKSKTVLFQKSEEETIIFMEGAQENDKNAMKESGKSVEKTTKNIESTAQGLIRGFQLLHTDTNGEDNTFTAVYGWDVSTAKATKGVEKANNDKEARETKGKTEGSSKSAEKLESKQVTSPDAKKFLPSKKP